MNTIRVCTIRIQKEIAYAGVPPQDNQTPPQEQVPLGDQALANPPIMSDGE